jgi:hypothetical protein
VGLHQPIGSPAADFLREWLKREKRYAVKSVTTITTAAGRSSEALISNVSNRGCRIATDLDIVVGERVTLVVEPLGAIEAEVRWMIGIEAGLQFIARDAFHSDYEFACRP